MRAVTKISPDLAPEAARFKDELPATDLSPHYSARMSQPSARSGAGSALCFPFQPLWVRARVEFGELCPLMASTRARSSLSLIRAACSGLMALLLVSLIGLAQQQAASAATSGGAGISASRQGDQAALPRIAGKAQALEVR